MIRRRRPASPSFVGFRFPPDVVLLAVRWYLRYGLSYRDVEELLAERGFDVDHVTIYRWVQRFTPLLIDAARPCRLTEGGRPPLLIDETGSRTLGNRGLERNRSRRISGELVRSGHPVSAQRRVDRRGDIMGRATWA